MGRIIPEDEISVDRIDSIKSDLIDTMTGKSTELKFVGSAENLSVREILPATDLGLAYEYWMTPTLTANGWAGYITDQRVADNTVLGIFGVKNAAADPKATALRFSVGTGKTKILDVIQIEKIYEAEMAEGFLTEPIVYTGAQIVNVEVYSKEAVAEPLVLNGFVAEPLGKITY